MTDNQCINHICTGTQCARKADRDSAYCWQHKKQSSVTNKDSKDNTVAFQILNNPDIPPEVGSIILQYNNTTQTENKFVNNIISNDAKLDVCFLYRNFGIYTPYNKSENYPLSEDTLFDYREYIQSQIYNNDKIRLKKKKQNEIFDFVEKYNTTHKDKLMSISAYTISFSVLDAAGDAKVGAAPTNISSFDDITLKNIRRRLKIKKDENLELAVEKKVELENFLDIEKPPKLALLLSGILYADNYEYLSTNDLNRFYASWNIHSEPTTDYFGVDDIFTLQNIQKELFKECLNSYNSLYSIGYTNAGMLLLQQLAK
jgi:hypothetical protein